MCSVATYALQPPTHAESAVPSDSNNTARGRRTSCWNYAIGCRQDASTTLRVSPPRIGRLVAAPPAGWGTTLSAIPRCSGRGRLLPPNRAPLDIAGVGRMLCHAACVSGRRSVRSTPAGPQGTASGGLFPRVPTHGRTTCLVWNTGRRATLDGVDRANRGRHD